MILDEEVILSKAQESFESAATAFGVGLSMFEMVEALGLITFGSALCWALGKDEFEVQEMVKEAAVWVHRENPQQLEYFLRGWEAVGG